METKIKKYLTKQRICALLTMLIMLLDMFSPYSVLLNKVNAVSPIEQNKPYFELSLHPIDASGDYDDWDEDTCYYYYDYDEDTDTPETYSGTRIVTMDIFIKNGQTVPRLNAGNIKLRYDKSVFTPIKENVKVVKKQTIITLDDPTDMEDWTLDGIYFDPSPATGLDLEEGIFRIDGATTETMEDTTLVATVQLKLGEGKTLADLTPDIFSISDDDDIMLAYDGGAYYVNGRDYLLFSGFQAGTPQVDSIEFKTAPTKNKYYHTETLDFTNGIITATYDNGDTEDVNIADAIAAGDLTVSSTTASETTKKVTLNYKGEKIDFEYYVLDSIAVKTNPTNTTYEHDDPINLAGGEITATYKNSSGTTTTSDISMTNAEITANKVKADYNNQTVNLNYHGKTTTVNLTVTDPVKSIAITTTPTNLTYDNGNTVSFAGGIITATTKSGATSTVATDDPSVTYSTNIANISGIPVGDRWTSSTSGLESGKQKITLTYEGKTDDYEIIVNDTISSITVTTDPTAKNKYGTASGSLDLTGMVVTATTSGGGTCTLAQGSVNIDFTGYNPNTLAVQSFNVSYSGITASNKVNIQLTNYITGISTSFSQTKFDYNTPIATIIANGSYIENYADGTSGSPKPITAGMVTGYVAKPAASLFDANHEFNETLTIKLTTSTNPFDVLPATATQVITIQDVIDNITVYDKPIKSSYKYNDPFNSNGGKISVNYKSGTNTIISMGSTNVSLSETDGSAVTASASLFTNGVATKPVTVTYTPEAGKSYTTTFNIKVNDIISGLDLSNAPSVIKYGDALTFNIDVSYESGNVVPITFADVTSNFNPQTVGTTQNITVSYGGYTSPTGFSIMVKDYVTQLKLSKNTVSDIYGTTFADLVTNNSLTYTVTYAKAGDKLAKPINDGVVTITPTYNPTAASQTLTVTYKDNDAVSYTQNSEFTGTIDVTLRNAVTKITITEVDGKAVTAGSRTNVKYNTPFTIKADVEYADSSYNGNQSFNSTDSEVIWSAGSIGNLGNAEVMLSIDGETDTALLKVQDYVTGISLSTNSVSDELGTTWADLVSDNSLQYIVTYAKGGAQTAQSLNVGSITISPNYDPTKASQTLTVTYTDNDTNSYTKDEEFTDTLAVNLSDIVTGIEINSINGVTYTSGSRTNVKYNTSFNVDITVVHADTTKNESKTFSVTDNEVTWSSGSLSTVGNGIIEVSYAGFAATADVKVQDYVTGITLSQSTLTDTYGTTFSDLVTNNSLKYTVTYASAGAQTAQAINDGVVSITPTYDPEALTQQLTITYTDSDTNSYTKDETFDDTLDITLNDAIKKVTITEVNGETVTAGERINVKYNTPFKVKASIEHAISANNEIKEFNSTDTEVTWSTGGTANLGNAEILLTVGGESDTTLVKVQDYVTGITLSSSSISDELDTSFANLVSDNNLKYTVNYAKAGAKTAQWINDGVVSISPTYDPAVGTQQLTITYTDNDTDSYTKDETFDATLDITLSDAVTGVEIKSVNGTAVTTGGRIDVKFGTDFNVDVLVKHADTANNENKTFSTSNNEISWDEGSLTTVGNGTIKVTYSGFTDTANVKVKDYVDKIQLIPNTVTDELGTTFTDLVSDNNLKYQVIYKSAGAKTAQAIDDGVVSITPTYDPTKATQSLTITYTDNDTNSYTKDSTFDATLDITLSDVVTKVTITEVNGSPVTPGEKINVKFDETFKIKADITHADTANNETKEFNSTDTDVSWTTGAITTVGDAEILLTYGGESDTTSVKVQDYVTGITLSSRSVSDELDTTFADLVSDNNLKYTVTYASAGAQTAQSIDDGVVSISPIYDPTASTQQLTITYTDTDTNSYTKDSTFDVTLDITLSDAVTGIEIKAVNGTAVTPGGEIDVKYGEAFDIVVTVKHADTTNNETKTFSTTNNEVSWDEGSLSTIGSGTVKVTYSGFTDTANVKVKDYVTGITLSQNTVTSIYGTEWEDLVSDNSLQYTVTYASAGAQTAQDLDDGVVTITPSYDPTSESQTLTVTYTDNDANSYTKDEEFTDTLSITLDDAVKKITIQEIDGTSVTAGSRVNVKYNENFTVKAYIEYADTTNNTEKTFNSNDPEITWTTGTISTIGNAEILLTYNGESDTALINVQDYVTGIALSQNTVTSTYGTEWEDIVSDNSLQYTVTYAYAGAQTAQDLDDGVVTITPSYDPTSESQTLTVTYTDNDANSYTKDEEFTDTLSITLDDAVKKITITAIDGKPVTAGSRVNVKYNENFTIDADIEYADTTNNTSMTFNSNDTEITWTTGTISTVGNAEILLTYNGESDTALINVQDYVTGIALSQNTVTSTYGTVWEDIVSDNSLQYTVTYAYAGAQTAQDLDDGVVTITPSYDPTSESQTLTVTYTDNDTNSYTKDESFTDTLSITLEDEVTRITITEVNGVPVTPGTRIDVDYGKPFDVKVYVEYADTTNNTTKTFSSTDTEITWTTGTITTLGNAEIQVTYGGLTDTAEINVEDYIVDYVITAPSKTEYEYGEDLDLSDAEITIVTASGDRSQTIPVTDGMISGYDATETGAQTVTITYNGKTQDFGIIVSDSIQSITMDNTPKDDYLYGEELDLTNGTIKVTRSSGDTVINIEPGMISGYDPTVIGPQTITVTYEGETTTYTVTVSDYMDHITITRPDKLLYNLNESEDLTGGTVSVIMASGAVQETVPMDNSMISGFDTSSTGSKTITVSYKGLPTETFSITVQDLLSEMIINTLPDKLDYLYGEAMDLTGGTIKITRESGAEEILPMTPSMISGFTTKTLGVVTLTVTYEGHTQTFDINVKDYVSGAILVEPNKKVYECGEGLDLTGGYIKIMMANGTVKEQVALTGAMISGFDTSTPGVKTLTVTYKEYTKTFNITVVDKLSGIALHKEPNKTIYKYGENLDVTGGQIKVIKSSGTKIVDITPEMISGYNPKQSGYQVITVTYEGKTTQFVVYVYPEVAPSTPTQPTNNDNSDKTNTPSKTPTNKKKKTTTINKTTNTKPKDNSSDKQDKTNEVVETPVKKPTKPDTKNTVSKNTTNKTNTTKQKETITLGDKDTNDENKDNKENKGFKKKLALGIILGSLILLLILLITRKNTTILVEEDGELVIGGKEKIDEDDPVIDVNKYLDEDTYNKRAGIILNDDISEKLDGKVITIKHRDKVIKYEVKYDDEPVEIILDAIDDCCEDEK